MRCPQCGHWNRASFPRCFKCGAVLPKEPAADQKPEAPNAGPAGKIYIQINEEGKATAAMDERDKLAQEMKELVARKQKGEIEQQRLRESGAKQGFAPTGRDVETLTGRTGAPFSQRISRSVNGEPVEGDVRPDAIPVVSTRVIDYDEYGDGPLQTPVKSKGKAKRYKTHRRFGFSRLLRTAALLIIVGVVLGAVYQFIARPILDNRNTEPLQERAIITPSILNDMPSHLVRIPGEEGQSIRIKEMKQSYLVVGGYATFEVPDYRWYEGAESVTQETVMATLTPYLQTGAGEEKPLEKISYEVEIPLSPLTLISPSSTFTEVSTALYQIQFEVAENSTVYIYRGAITEANKEDLSDLVNTRSGSLSLNVSVSAIGNNDITIVTRAQYYRENSMTITLYRAPQQITLNLAADIATRYTPQLVEDQSQPKDAKGNYPMIEPNMTVKGTTVTWANIEVISPYVNLDTTKVAATGEFSFEAVFDHFGDNVIEIHASAPGFETSVVKHTVYYVPVAAIYTRKAWDMDTQYTDYLNNSEKRIANTQIYLCEGTITQILSERPAMAILKLKKSPERTVLITNYSNDTWTVGAEYRIFADAYGLYNGAPWLSGRYTYKVN
ncbi:MAG: hypothetical protein IJ189_08255 [Clostridia bacterium]|nr:hypothetical protein [Clostridia bacterium]